MTSVPGLAQLSFRCGLRLIVNGCGDPGPLDIAARYRVNRTGAVVTRLSLGGQESRRRDEWQGRGRGIAARDESVELGGAARPLTLALGLALL